MDPQVLKAMEAPMMALANSAGGDMRKLLYAFFSFLHRRTDFYLVPHPDDLKEGTAKMGFPEGEAEKFLLAAFRQFPLRRIPRQKEVITTREAAAVDTKATAPASTPTAPSKDEAAAAKIDNAAKKGDAESSKKISKAADLDTEVVRYNEEGLQIPIGNGGSTKRYKWTQTIDECTVLVGLPDGLKAKDLDVSIKSMYLHVQTKEKDESKQNPKTVFLKGPLVHAIQPDESTWSMEGGVMIIILTKVQKTFWDTVIEGDEKIDTSMVDSRRHISSYDEATQGQLRRIMFDQKQQEKGLPTSDEMLGVKTIPPLPPGVEYIDRTTFEEEDEKKKKKSSG